MLYTVPYTFALFLASPVVGLPSSGRASFRREKQDSALKHAALVSDSTSEPAESFCTA